MNMMAIKKNNDVHSLSLLCVIFFYSRLFFERSCPAGPMRFFKEKKGRSVKWINPTFVDTRAKCAGWLSKTRRLAWL
jgi:hypothetical protein